MNDPDIESSAKGVATRAAPASQAEVKAAIQGIGEEGFAKLSFFARKLLLERPQLQAKVEPAELVQDAIADTLLETRSWRPDRYTLLEHLFGVIRSRVSHMLEKSRREVSSPEMEEGALASPDWADDNESEGVQSLTERQMIDDEEYARVRAYFFDDQEAWSVLELMLCENKRAEILDELGITVSRYETIRKRIRAKALRFLPQTGASDEQ